MNDSRISWLDKSGSFNPIRFGDFDPRDYTAETLIADIMVTFPDMETPDDDDRRVIVLWLADHSQ